MKLILVLLLSCLSLFAQDFPHSETSRANPLADPTVLFADNKGSITYQKSIGMKGLNFLVNIYDDNLKINISKNLEPKIGTQNFTVQHLTYSNGKLTAWASLKQEKKEVLYALELSTTTLDAVGQAKEICPWGKYSYSIASSPNQQFHLIHYLYDELNSKGKVLILDNTLQVRTEADWISPYPNVNNRVLGFQINDAGEAFIKVYSFLKLPVQYVRKDLPNHTIIVYHLKPNQKTLTQYAINFGDENIIAGLQICRIKEKLIGAVTTVSTDEKYTQKLILFSIDESSATTTKLYTLDFPQAERPSSNIQENMEIKVLGNGDFYVVGHALSGTFYSDLIVVKFKSDGQFMWYNKSQVLQTPSIDIPHYTPFSFTTLIHEDELFLLLNVSNDKAHSFRYSRFDQAPSSFMLMRCDKSGNTSTLVSDNTKNGIPHHRTGKLISDGRFICVTNKDNNNFQLVEFKIW